jgi:hypothetical protein
LIIIKYRLWAEATPVSARLPRLFFFCSHASDPSALGLLERLRSGKELWGASSSRIAPPKAQGLRRFSKGNYSRDLLPAEWGLGVSLHGSNPELLMSALGHSRPMYSVPEPINVRCHSNSDIIVRRSEVTLRAISETLNVLTSVPPFAQDALGDRVATT